MLMKKKILSLFLCLAMCLPLSVPAFAAESEPVFTGPYAEMKTSIYRQLKAQDMLEHFDIYLSALIPSETETNSVSRASRTWTSSSGGVLCYNYDMTYHGDTGYAAVSISHMNVARTNEYLAGKFVDAGALISSLTGIAISKLSSKIAMFSFLGSAVTSTFTAISIIEAANDILAKESIEDADGYSMLTVAYDSISGKKSTILLGWDDHPTITLNQTSAYNVSFNYA